MLRLAAGHLLEFLRAQYVEVKIGEIEEWRSYVVELCRLYRAREGGRGRKAEIAKALGGLPGGMEEVVVEFLTREGGLVDGNGVAGGREDWRPLLVRLTDGGVGRVVVGMVGICIAAEEGDGEEERREKAAVAAEGWSLYLTSRDFWAARGSEDTVTAEGVDLGSRPRSRWSEGERAWMEDAVAATGLPLNGLLDGLEGRGGEVCRRIEGRLKEAVKKR